MNQNQNVVPNEPKHHSNFEKSKKMDPTIQALRLILIIIGLPILLAILGLIILWIL